MLIPESAWSDNTPSITARICCLDLDTFFVSVERLLDPSLVGKPVVVGATPGNRGVVTACSYEVREFGVRSGMSATMAHRLAPHAVFLPGHFRNYSTYAKRVKGIIERFSPVVRTASIDEFYLDFSGCERLYCRPEDSGSEATIERVVREMRQTIQDEVGLPASVGIATTKVIAKMASGLAKPAGVLMVAHGREFDFVAPLSVRKFPGIGPVAERRLNDAGIKTLGQLLSLADGPERRRFEDTITRVCRGVYPDRQTKLANRDRPAFREHDARGDAAGTISNERTFGRDVGDWRRVEEQLLSLSERVCWRARKRGVRARTVTLKLRYANFETKDRSHTGPPTHCETTVYQTILRLLHKNRVAKRAVRLVGVRLSNLVGDDPQLSLSLQSRSPTDGAQPIDAIREKFGYDAIRLGATKGSGRWLADDDK